MHLFIAGARRVATAITLVPGSLLLLADVLLGRAVVLEIFRRGGAELGLVVTDVEAVLDSLGLYLLIGQEWKFLGSLNVRHVLEETLGEDEIDLFERAVSSLGVGEVDDRQEAGVADGEEEVGTPANLGDHDRSDHDDEEVPEPVRAGGDSVSLGASLDGRDLGWVQPGQRQPGGTERGNVGEETDSSTLRGRGSTRNQAGEDDDHRSHLANSTPQEKLAATDLLNKEPGESSEDRVDNHVDTTEEERHGLGLADGVLEENREIVDDGVATSNLLHELRGDTEHHAAEVLSLATGEQVGVGGLGTVAGSANGVHDDSLLELSFVVGDFETAESSDNLLTFLVALTGEQPARRLRHEVDTEDNDETEEDLEGDGESRRLDQFGSSDCQ